MKYYCVNLRVKLTPGSTRSEMLLSVKAMLLAKDIRDRERGGRAEIGLIEGDAEDKSPASMELLCSTIGERPATLPNGTSDEKADQEQMSQVTLYQ